MTPGAGTLYPGTVKPGTKKKTGMRLGDFKPQSLYDIDVCEHEDLLSRCSCYNIVSGLFYFTFFLPLKFHDFSIHFP